MSVLDGLGPHYLGFYEDKESMDQEDFNFGDGSVDLKRTFVGRWEDRIEFIKTAVFLQIDGNSNTGTQTIFSPARYPGYELARAYRASIRARLPASGKDADDVITHRIAKVDVFYRVENFGGTDPDDPDEDDPDFVFVEESVESHTELIPIHGTFTKTSARITDQPTSNPDGSPYKAADTYLYEEHKTRNYINTIYDYKLKLPFVVFPRWGDMSNASGKLNRTVFITPSGLVCLPGTLRYDGISAVTKRELSRNALVWEMTHAFAFRRETWDTIPVVTEDGFGIAHQYVDPVLFSRYELRRIFIPYSDSRSQELTIIFGDWGQVGTPMNRSYKYMYGILTESEARLLWNRLPNHAFLNAKPIILPDED